jgi:transposase
VIARRVGLDRKTVRRYIARGLEPPVYGPRKPRIRQLHHFENYLRERVTAFPELTGRRLHRELRELGYTGSYSVLTDFLRDIRPPAAPEFERRFETPPGRQAQVDFAHFRVVFTDEPGTERVIWLFSFVLGHSRMLWGRFVPHQDLPTLLRCQAGAFEALGGVPEQILYDRMRAVFSREDPASGHIVYNPTLVAFARHYGYLPKACQPYRAKTKGKVERPFRYIREDFFLGRSFRNVDDLNSANSITGSIPSRTHAPTPPPDALWLIISPRSASACSRCRQGRSRSCCDCSGGSPAMAWSLSTAISTACRTLPAGASSRCTAWRTSCAFSRKAG